MVTAESDSPKLFKEEKKNKTINKSEEHLCRTSHYKLNLVRDNQSIYFSQHPDVTGNSYVYFVQP